jgi:hypothetical protein
MLKTKYDQKATIKKDAVPFISHPVKTTFLFVALDK